MEYFQRSQLLYEDQEIVQNQIQIFYEVDYMEYKDTPIGSVALDHKIHPMHIQI